STNLFPTRSAGAGAPTDGDIVSVYPISGEVRRVSVLADGVTPAPAANSHPRSSLTGRVVVFDTLAGGAFSTPTTGTARVAGRQVAIVDRQPQVEIANLDLGTVAIDSAGPEWYLVLTNHGPAAFVPGTIETSARDFIVSGGSCLESVGMAIAPGASCTVQIMLLPRALGPLSSTLMITEDGAAPVVVTAELTGVGGDPTLASIPSGGHGGDAVVGTMGGTMKFTLANVTNRALKVVALALAGTDPNDFVISRDQCTDQKVAAGSTCELSVTFRPTAGGRRTATVVARTSTDVYATILVSGDAHYAPTLTASAPAVLVGSRLAIVGNGFAPNANVTVGWADGSGSATTVTTDGSGAVSFTLVLRATDRTGQRTLVAQTIDGQVASVFVKVLAKGAAFGPNSPAWPQA
ncbi:MAG: choice-of-anchor D domain-containing protein, partial [Actinobacteria bacterium]|nr:choice-of-anchor D domain-containing protein [Actinomycetota bacterium]